VILGKKDMLDKAARKCSEVQKRVDLSTHTIWVTAIDHQAPSL
jgi:hypothetical protein